MFRVRSLFCLLLGLSLFASCKKQLGERCSKHEQCISGWCAKTCMRPEIIESIGSPGSDPEFFVCDAYERKCDGACKNLRKSKLHCGRCNNACPQGTECVKGVCGCGENQEDCNQSCVDTQKNPSHCGKCNNACNAQEFCLNGKCFCKSGTTRCAGVCIDLSVDNNQHCGRCNNACGTNEACVQQVCTCKSPKCDGACVDHATDTKHCGQCNNACKSDEECAGGKCVCKGGGQRCGSACIDVKTSLQHCGACNNACTTGELCRAGVCEKACLNKECGPDGIGGSCGVCPKGGFCSSGKCSATPILFQREAHLKPGMFSMGSGTAAGEPSEHPQHTVTLTHDIAMGKFEVTNKEFKELMGYIPTSTSCSVDECPVQYIHWQQAVAFCNAKSKKLGFLPCYDCSGSKEQVVCTIKAAYQGKQYTSCLGFRLPTEAEWEYAVRAGGTTPTYGKLADIAWYKDNAKGAPHPVGKKHGNAWGLYDMLGNVAEWTYDSWFRQYTSQAVVDPVNSSGLERIVRGGDWSTGQTLRASQRAHTAPSTQNGKIGFRICRTLR